LARVRKFGYAEETIGFFYTRDEALCAEYDHGRPLSRERLCDCPDCSLIPPCRSDRVTA
jgi:hypothetical protein